MNRDGSDIQENTFEAVLSRIGGEYHDLKIIVYILIYQLFDQDNLRTDKIVSDKDFP
jgi:hypothetical protein